MLPREGGKLHLCGEGGNPDDTEDGVRNNSRVLRLLYVIVGLYQ